MHLQTHVAITSHVPFFLLDFVFAFTSTTSRLLPCSLSQVGSGYYSTQETLHFPDIFQRTLVNGYDPGGFLKDAKGRHGTSSQPGQRLRSRVAPTLTSWLNCLFQACSQSQCYHNCSLELLGEYRPFTTTICRTRIAISDFHFLWDCHGHTLRLLFTWKLVSLSLDITKRTTGWIHASFDLGNFAFPPTQRVLLFLFFPAISHGMSRCLRTRRSQPSGRSLRSLRTTHGSNQPTHFHLYQSGSHLRNLDVTIVDSLSDCCFFEPRLPLVATSHLSSHLSLDSSLDPTHGAPSVRLNLTLSDQELLGFFFDTEFAIHGPI